MRYPAALFRRVREEKNAIRFLLSRVLWQSGLCRLFTIDLGYGRLRFAPTALSAQLWVDPARRANDAAFLDRVLRPGDVAVDVGANVGSLTVLAASRVGPAGHVYAIEANPRTCRFLKDNIALNGLSDRVRVVCAAAGSMNGPAHLLIGRADDQDRIAERGIPVRMCTLDALLAHEARHVRLLKIDVEGFERAVLEGAREVIARTEIAYVEYGYGLGARYKYAERDVLEILDESGFTPFDWDPEHGLTPLDRHGPAPNDLVAIAMDRCRPDAYAALTRSEAARAPR